MNYSKTIREYCQMNKGQMFDVSLEMKKHFSMVPYKTLLKILNRLEAEGIVSKYSKGLYVINTDKESKEDPIISFYANGNTGVVVGYKMYNEFEITDYKEKPIVIYTNAMETTTKNLGDDYTLILYPIFPFDESIRKLVQALDILENSDDIIDRDLMTLSRVVGELLQYYDDYSFTDIVKAHHYQYATICTLDRLLNDLHIKNRCLEIYKEHDMK